MYHGLYYTNVYQPKNKEPIMNKLKMNHGTIKITWGEQSMTLGLSLPYFLAQAVNGRQTPEEWDDAIAEMAFKNYRVIPAWSGRIDFPASANEELQKKGRTGRKGAGQPASGSGLDQGKEESAVRGQPGRRVGGRGLRQLSIPPRIQKVPAVKTRNMARTGQKGRTARKGAVSLVSAKW